MYIILAILIFGLLIVVHEFGHFITAKLCGVKVNEFAICMGPALLQKTIGETTYSLRCLPIGGYCAMEGENDESADPRAFINQSWWKRLLILCAGAAANFLTGVLILLILFGSAEGFTTAVISDFFEGCPLDCEEVLQRGDEICKVDGKQVYIFSDLSLLLERKAGGTHDLTIRRNGEIIELKDIDIRLQTYIIDGQQVQKYGLYFSSTSNSPALTVRYAVGTAIDFGRMVLYGLEDLIRGTASVSEVSGVVGIVSAINESGQEAQTRAEGVENVFYFGAFLAVNLAFMNMLPIPALDGGHVFCLLITTLIETISHKKVDPKYEGYIHAGGMVVLLILIGLVTVKDIVSLF